jgi:hypothetical protein
MIRIIDAIKAINPTAIVMVTETGNLDTAQIQWLEETPVISNSDIQTKLDELQAAYPIQELREKRNILLASSDWTGLSDSALTSEVSAKWKLYRQKLRALPSGLDTVDKVKAVTWPEKPE